LKKQSLRETVLRSFLLFLISIVLVAGFWFHSEFYKLGLYPLLLIGGFVVFLMISALRATATVPFLRKRPSSTLIFSREEGNKILNGIKTKALLPLGLGESIKIGSLCSAGIEPNGRSLATLRIKDSYRKLLADLTEEEILSSGYESLDNFKEEWKKRDALNPDELVQVIDFEILEEGK